MSYTQLAYFHLATVVPAFILGTYLLFSKKGSPLHRRLGKLYMLLMLTTAVITLLMPSIFNWRLLNHFGFIHLFSLFVFYNVPAAYFAVRRNDIKAHRGYMIGLYIGGLLIAGLFAFAPNRMLHQWALTLGS